MQKDAKFCGPLLDFIMLYKGNLFVILFLPDTKNDRTIFT